MKTFKAYGLVSGLICVLGIIGSSCSGGGGSSNSNSNNQGSVSSSYAVWKATNPLGLTRTDGNTSTYAGPSARYDALVIKPSGASISGSWNEMDTLGASVAYEVSGSLVGSNLTIQLQDQCNRTVTGTGTINGSSLPLLVSGPATSGSNCGAFNATIPLSLATPVVYTASGTYTYSAASKSLSFNWTSTNAPQSSGFTPFGPGLWTLSNVEVTPTTLGIYGTIFKRGSGSAGDISGTWTNVSPLGDVWECTFNANGTVSETLHDVSHQFFSSADAYSWHAPNDYNIGLRYMDYNHTATAVSVSGPGINGSLSMIYESNRGEWRPQNPRFSIGATHSLPPLTYTFSITKASGISTETATVGCFVEDFAIPVSGPTAGGSQAFSWTKVPYPMRYAIDMGPWISWNYGYGDNNTNLFDVSSAPYTGPTLSTGMSYTYNLGVVSLTRGMDCRSSQQAIFTY